MNPLDTDLPLVYLKPGELFVATEPTLVSTVLGSCVSVVLFNERLSAGAICHGLYPACAEEICSGKCFEEFKYIDCSILHMVKKFDFLNIKREDIQCKIFGGSNLIGEEGSASVNIGGKNIEAAVSILRQENIQVNVSDVGGRQGRKIFFYSHTGEILLKRLKKLKEV